MRGIRRALHSSESADLLTVKVQFLTFGQHAEDINRVSFHRESDAQTPLEAYHSQPFAPVAAHGAALGECFETSQESFDAADIAISDCLTGARHKIVQQFVNVALRRKGKPNSVFHLPAASVLMRAAKPSKASSSETVPSEPAFSAS